MRILLIRMVLGMSLLSYSACTAASMFSSEGYTTAAFGSAAGTGIGYLVGQEIGKQTENMLLGSALGGGLGLMAGGLLHERNVKSAQQREVLIREARMVGSTQRELDALREKLYDSTRWGGNETKSWNDRYWGDNYNYPYEGRLGQ